MFQRFMHEQFYTKLERRNNIEEKIVELENPGEDSDVV